MSGKVPDDSLEPSGSETGDVLDDDDVRLLDADDAVELDPEAAPLSVEAGAVPCDGDVLAGEPSTEDVGPRKRSIWCCDIANVLEEHHAGEVVAQQALAERIDLHLVHELSIEHGHDAEREPVDAA